MHFDPLGSEELSSANRANFDADEVIAAEEAPARPAREGLPKRFRMRHGRHYVDELLGDAPPRTVREIPISEIEPPPDEALSIERLEILEDSIRQLGVLEPLLVIRSGLEYRVIAGMRRLRAARTIGLSTVPCLVTDVDEEKAMELRQAVVGHLAIPVPIASEPLPAEPAPQPSAQEVPEAAPSRPVGDEGIDPGLRRMVLEELAAAESLRATIASASADLLARTIIAERQATSPAAIVSEAIAAVGLEARLRGVRLQMLWPENDASISLDGPRCRTVLTGLLQSMLTLATRETTALEIATRMTSVRPALIVECRLRQDGREQIIASVEASERFFDAEWTEHPCGPSGAQSLAALLRVARAHGGRVQASPTTITFVVPKLLTEW